MSSPVTIASLQRITLFVTFVVYCVGSCNRPIAKDALVGSYRLSAKAGTIRLELFPDGRFLETIHAANSTSTIQRGTWTPPSAASPQIGLDGLWLPPDFAPDYIKEADKEAGNGPKYTKPGYWVGTPIYEFGRIVLPIFPDADVKFERVPTAATQ